MSETLLELRGIDVNYGAAKALDHINLAVPPGQIVSLLGGNASGKSTTMKTILGLVKPAAGEVVWAGQDISTWHTPRRVASGIASVPEARRVFGPMTVEDNLIMGAYTQTDRSRIREDLQAQYERFPRLAERRLQAAGTLSGGEQQMLAFARALMSRPRLICMDEPTMGLSPRLVDEVLATIATLNSELGVAVLMVEQQAELALSIAHYGYVLATGQLVLEGPAAELLNNPRVQEAYLGKTIENGEHA
ncbi:ABC transporter ATP-binding protein [Propionimicrobium sp. PCR01-08-3]|uniref:ABC transporter ATP-binding protein n=1 Tax=Propionimicrobium sp. PCR01-08-3 TaxID=3052086 RepID=UPI00255CDE48|nr:ABC transporter ATP-binding protein [Propionimicrobium sp. PCR01-08-3]WIY84107.1 ABC transporter ATP-binding protein [Propionimicrobium sp. PCR01-08-3]